MKKLVSLRNKKGFTLVELIIVIAIIAVLAAVVAPQYIKYVDKSKASTDINNVAAVESAINVLCADGTIKVNEVITYNTNGTLASDKTDDASHADEVTALVGDVKALTHNGVGNVVFTISFDAGTPTVTAAPDYKTTCDPSYVAPPTPTT